MTELCLRCGEHPVADETPPRFPFCDSCWPVVASQGNYLVDEEGNFGGWLSDAEVEADFAITAEAFADEEPPDHAVSLADLLAGRDATDDECPF